MPKHDFLAPKAIANRMKSKGLQKLRWFCQVCQKQCRDENGFKCHTSSDSHQRQMLIVANNPDRFIGGYSAQFERAFLENLKLRHGTKRVRANVVYNEYISDKMHIHMNATQWTTLSGFIQYLGRKSKCLVDETEKGWYIQYIDRDPRKIARQEELERKLRSDLDHEERNRRFIQKQLKIAKASGAREDFRPTKLQRAENNAKLSLNLRISDKRTKAKSIDQTNAFAEMTKKECSEEERRITSQEKDQGAGDADNWILEGIIVKVLNDEVGDGKYRNKKGVVERVEDEFCATLRMLDTSDVLQLDQDDLETVIPKEGNRVVILRGKHRKEIAQIVSIAFEEFSANLRLVSGPQRYIHQILNLSILILKMQW
uniref:Uncharacterized protein AlNc14C46G3712 n=1 Tax=Albugo laibachii Nc14 TaxID=890382 RepID=F0WAI7_9STRA|nr:conserved hypothetical protein [Albugo laibachii Nc14]|eukprot:CCA18158.1 conserved hypothetical protein [Albugo laibachii Nc14]